MKRINKIMLLVAFIISSNRSAMGMFGSKTAGIPEQDRAREDERRRRMGRRRTKDGERQNRHHQDGSERESEQAE